MRRFKLIRYADISGVSGTGTVAEGIEFGDGVTVVRWLDTPPGIVHPTTVVHDGIANVIALHGHGGATVVDWID